MSKLTTLIGGAFVALAATAAMALPTAATALAQPTPAPSISASAPANTRGWLSIYNGTAPQGSNAVQLRTVSDRALGARVVDRDGRSLYRFDKDTANPSKSNCNNDCAVTWPPLLVSRGQALYVDGVDPALTGFIERADGSCQITIGGWPVYYFSKDKKPGDVNGQGVAGTWFAVNSTGGKALAK
ncbi:hypothetical protein [Nocardia seriolae]|uniref:Lipoprotein n=1 Tax=Nocardia seriolae TaxID=37332 RepID=A0A0B8NF98_9NOCA|nr:hypothetical protein [Nocardia seriolae]APA95864.1 hypothetical protein NS506_01796 [Nocardia seriolae]MTJ66033.1 hypothetical protein [Nocardia seriolae]MTJ75440.1 hypothetical protein [Nocardia seriolae]MTJ86046.1 hypothetical protein [Nocardia seriolae]MTK30041.1 hypothetical protein [Nocardia seriolae]